jgi:hypothetical protein
MNKEAVTGINMHDLVKSPKVAFASYTGLKMTIRRVLDMYTASGYVAQIIVLWASRAKRSPRSDPDPTHCVVDADGLTRYDRHL